VALRDRVTVVADETLAETTARVTVNSGGARQVAEHDLAAPLTPEVRAAKLRAKARALVGDSRELALHGIVAGADPAALAAWLAL
jgi:hypothetical protein